MTNTILSSADRLRGVAEVCEPDPRVDAFAIYDRDLGRYRDPTLLDSYSRVSNHDLREYVPETIRTSFETARNLYLYAYFVYRFYPVSEHQALVCLEMALRERYENEIPRSYCRNKNPGLKAFLSYAIDEGDIKNERFLKWHEIAERRARSREMIEAIEMMKHEGLTEIEVDDSIVSITDSDRDHEYINILLESLPFLRNHYAHGSTALHKEVLGTIQVVSEIINQVYAPRG